jgi:hypothetical protein
MRRLTSCRGVVLKAKNGTLTVLLTSGGTVSVQNNNFKTGDRVCLITDISDNIVDVMHTAEAELHEKASEDTTVITNEGGDGHVEFDEFQYHPGLCDD